MQVPFLRELLRNDWIDIKEQHQDPRPRPVLTFVGKLGGTGVGRAVAGRIFTASGRVSRRGDCGDA